MSLAANPTGFCYSGLVPTLDRGNPARVYVYGVGPNGFELLAKAMLTGSSKLVVCLVPGRRSRMPPAACLSSSAFGRGRDSHSNPFWGGLTRQPVVQPRQSVVERLERPVA